MAEIIAVAGTVLSVGQGLKTVFGWVKDTWKQLHGALAVHGESAVVLAHFGIVSTTIREIETNLQAIESEVLVTEEAQRYVKPFLTVADAFKAKFQDLPAEFKKWQAVAAAEAFVKNYKKDIEDWQRWLTYYQPIFAELRTNIVNLAERVNRGELDPWAYPFWTSCGFNSTSEVSVEMLAQYLRDKTKQGSEERYRDVINLLVHKHLAGKVTFLSFKSFMLHFGPVETCLAKAEAVISSGAFTQWFRLISRAEAEAEAKKRAKPDFIIRPSETWPRLLACTYRLIENEVAHMLIVNTASGYRLLFPDDEKLALDMPSDAKSSEKSRIYSPTLAALVEDKVRAEVAAAQKDPTPQWRCIKCGFAHAYDPLDEPSSPPPRVCVMCSTEQNASMIALPSHKGAYDPTSHTLKHDLPKSAPPPPAKTPEEKIADATLKVGRLYLSSDQYFEKCGNSLFGFGYWTRVFKLSPGGGWRLEFGKTADSNEGFLNLIGCRVETAKVFTNKAGVECTEVHLISTDTKGPRTLIIRSNKNLMSAWVEALKEHINKLTHTPHPPHDPPPASALRWACVVCTFMNEPVHSKRAEKCGKCGSPWIAELPSSPVGHLARIPQDPRWQSATADAKQPAAEPDALSPHGAEGPQWFTTDGKKLLGEIRDKIASNFGAVTVTETPRASFAFSTFKLYFPTRFPADSPWLVGPSGTKLPVTDFIDPSNAFNVNTFVFQVMRAIERERAIRSAAGRSL